MLYLAGTPPCSVGRDALGSGLFQASYLLGFMSLQTGTALAAPVTACVLSGHDASPQSQWETAISSRATPGTPGGGET